MPMVAKENGLTHSEESVIIVNKSVR